MTDARLDGQRVILMGEAEPALVAATVAAFEGAGARTEQLGTEALEAAAAPNVCICFARTPSGVALDASEPAALEEAVRSALLVPQRVALAAARRMSGSGGGAIVIVGSVDAMHAYPRRAAAAIAMGGLLGLVRAMAVELSGAGVRANLVVAGPLSDPVQAPPVDEALLERTLLRSPVHRLGHPDEVAAAIRFVAGPDARFMTGQTIRVDGGWASLNQAPEGMRFP